MTTIIVAFIIPMTFEALCQQHGRACSSSAINATTLHINHIFTHYSDYNP